MIRALVFDIDDTLQDWPGAIERALRAVLPEIPVTLRPEVPERLRRAIAERYYIVREGRVVNREHWRLLFESAQVWQAALPEAGAPEAERIGKRFQSLLEPLPYADARPALEALRGNTLATLSNNPRSEESLERLGLGGFFSTVVSAVDDWRKPDRRAFERVCHVIGIAAKDALYVGDSISHDVEGALGAGLTAVWIDRYDERHPLPEGARRIASLLELEELLADLGS
ncbi:MAG: HAD family hydrolase [Chloroflexi bacterium]|nr:HAD family hydrolase [Chloroflexota bacterium]